MARLLPLGTTPVNEGERLVVDFLRHALPDTYTLVANVEIAHQGRPPYDFDLIVLAPHALYVVEIKQWRGGIRGDDTLWTVGGGARRPNPFPKRQQQGPRPQESPYGPSAGGRPVGSGRRRHC